MLDVYEYHTAPATLSGYDDNWMMGPLTRLSKLKQENYFRRNEEDMLNYEAMRVGDHIEILDGDHVVGRIVKEGDSYVLYRGERVSNRTVRENLSSYELLIGFIRAIAGSRW